MKLKVERFKLFRWYFGDINRRRAIELLQVENNIVGSFLVRDSDQVKIYFVILKFFQIIRPKRAGSKIKIEYLKDKQTRNILLNDLSNESEGYEVWGKKGNNEI